MRSPGSPRARRRRGSRRLAALALASALAPLPRALAETPPRRLSDWLLERDAADDAYPLGLSWRLPEERPPQHARWQGLLDQLDRGGPDLPADPKARAALKDWLARLPATGRVPVAMADARWLQANPARDPVLLPGHEVVLPRRPLTVTVVTGDGERCAVQHVQGREAGAYLAVCDPGATRADWVWIAQPDGRVQRYGRAAWNRQAQDEPAPGSWIWAPARDAGWPESFSELLMAHLASQGPAPDAPPAGGGATPGVVTTARLRLPAPASAPSRDLPPTVGDWGGVGLLQTPTARMRPAGAFGLSLSHSSPYTRLNVMGQPFDWMEAGFRYVDVSNRLYGPQIAGNQSYKDKSFDVKLRVLSESAYLPEVAVGIRDLAGTGLFSSEYVVASKRTGNFDWSLGLGWGYVGGRGNLRNPLSALSPKFDTRTNNFGTGGDFSVTQYFRGPTSLFGGVQWQSPWESLIFKAEYDGNDYQHEPQNNNQTQRTPVNVGLVYRWSRFADVSLGLERGNTLLAGLTLHGQVNEIFIPKIGDPPRVPVARGRPARSPDWAATARDIKTQSGWQVSTVEKQGRELKLTVDDADAVYWRDRTDRATSVLHRDAPADVDRFRVVQRRRGVELAEFTVDRDAWTAERTEPVPPRARRASVMARPPYQPDAQPGSGAMRLFEDKPPRFEAGLGFGYQQILGGPDGFLLYQLSAAERVKIRLRPDTWVQGTAALRLIDNFDRFDYTAPSNLPRVRTYQREYATTARLTVPNLQLTHVGQWSDNHFYSLYGGYLESMFAGTGAEWLYRPFGSRFALGLDVNQVWQRNFDQHFGLRDYSTLTGHATLYWDTGWNRVQFNLSAGRYLAGDRGVTVDVFRTFENGARMGAFFTKTNVSKEQFGEGGFDKGVYVSIPFDAFLTRSSGSDATFLWRPLTRDGGAKLARSVQLYDFTRTRDERALEFGPAPVPNHAAAPADRRDRWVPPSRGPVPFTQVEPRASAARWVAADGRYETRVAQALYAQGFRNVEVRLEPSRRLIVKAAHQDVRPASRAVGLMARAAQRLAPLDAREIRIVFSERNTPTVRYDFIDLPRLEQYFDGRVNLAALVPTVAVENLDPSRFDLHPFEGFGDAEPGPPPPGVGSLLPDLRPVQRVGRDVVAAGRALQDVNWWWASAASAGLLTSSALLDRKVDRRFADHAGSRWLEHLSDVGSALPWLGMAGAGLAALDNDPVRSRVGYAALEAGSAAFLASTGLKYAVGRARPELGLGASEFSPFAGGADYGAFPSRHTAVAWAVATPFAMHYDAPWLYGLAALTNVGRLSDREHWLSDTVAGSLIGYGLGRLFYESSDPAVRGRPRLVVHPSGVSVTMEFQ